MSIRTTYFGPKVSLRTVLADQEAPHLHLDSNSTLELANVAPIKFSNITTASPVSTFIPDGCISIVSHSGNSLVIAIRSGATTYRFTNDAGSVL